MKRILAACLVVLLLPAFGCGRRVTVQKPDGGRVVINDRVTDILADRALADVIARAPASEQAALIRELIASKERLAQSQMQNEDKRAVSFWGTVLEVLKIAGPMVAGVYIAK